MLSLARGALLRPLPPTPRQPPNASTAAHLGPRLFVSWRRPGGCAVALLLQPLAMCPCFCTTSRADARPPIIPFAPCSFLVFQVRLARRVWVRWGTQLHIRALHPSFVPRLGSQPPLSARAQHATQPPRPPPARLRRLQVYSPLTSLFRRMLPWTTFFVRPFDEVSIPLDYGAKKDRVLPAVFEESVAEEDRKELNALLAEHKHRNVSIFSITLSGWENPGGDLTQPRPRRLLKVSYKPQGSDEDIVIYPTAK